ncbi:MAG: hypothetical protein M0Q92_10730 [Methanoregula sp.]|nr:hypothetical protein [Methanoregula sp.]
MLRPRTRQDLTVLKKQYQKTKWTRRDLNPSNRECSALAPGRTWRS